jgi:recombination protein RecT
VARAAGTEKRVVTGLQRMATIGGYLKKNKEALKALVPGQVDADRLLNVYLAVIRKDPKLQACSPESLLVSLKQAATFGLEIGSMNSAFLVPYGTEATLIPGYMGLVDLAKRGAGVRDVEAVLVYKGEKFSADRDFEAPGGWNVTHKPNVMQPKNDEDIVGGYCVIWFHRGEERVPPIKYVFMSRDEIEKRRDVSKARGGPWTQWFPDMCRKTLIRQAMKTLTLSAVINDATGTTGAQAVAELDQAEGLIDAEFEVHETEEEETPKETTKQRVKKRAKRTTKPKAEPEHVEVEQGGPLFDGDEGTPTGEVPF